MRANSEEEEQPPLREGATGSTASGDSLKISQEKYHLKESDKKYGTDR